MRINLKSLAIVSISAIMMACAPAQQNSSLPKINDVWAIKDSAGKLTRIVVQKVTELNDTYFLNTNAEGKAGFIFAAALNRPGTSISVFFSAAKPSTELISHDNVQIETGFLCKTTFVPFVPNTVEYLGNTFIGKLSDFSKATSVDSQGECKIFRLN